jgi:hypothetical protein
MSDMVERVAVAIFVAADDSHNTWPTPEHPECVRMAQAAIAVARESIAASLDYEASVCPCEEDANVIRSCATLVRADFSYERAEEIDSALNPSPSAEKGR